jgi:hypothetical protein
MKIRPFSAETEILIIRAASSDDRSSRSRNCIALRVPGDNSFMAADSVSLAVLTAAADVNFSLRMFLISVYNGVAQSLAERQLDVELFSGTHRNRSIRPIKRCTAGEIA